MANIAEQMDSLIPSADNEYLPSPERDFTASDFASDTWEQARKKFMDAGIINVDPNDPELITAYNRTLDYFKDVGLSGLLATQAAYEFVVASAADSLPMSENNKGRFARDLGAMPEAFVGGGLKNLSLIDDVADAAAASAKQTISKTVNLADRVYIDPTKTGAIAGSFSLRTPLETGNFKRARELFKKFDGSDPRNFNSTNTKVFNETGWYINPSDNQWRFEINDKPAKINFKNFQGKELLNQRQITGSELFDEIQTLADNKSIDVSLTDFFKHEKLYKRYPHLKRMRVTFSADSGANASLGSFTSGQNLITINPAKVDLKDKRFKEILMHEIQHSIQEYEGFIPGASSSRIPFEVTEKHAKTLTSELVNARITRQELLNELDDVSLGEGYNTGPFFKLLSRDENLKPGVTLFASEESVVDKFAQAAKESGLPDNIFDLYPKEKGGVGGSPKLIQLGNTLNLLRGSHLDDVYHREAIENINEQLYRGTFGELEANVVGKSANMTPTERGLDPVNMEKVIATNQKVPEDFVGSYDATAGRAVSGKQPGFQRRKRSRIPELGVVDAKIDINFDGVYNSFDITNKSFNEMSAVQRAAAYSKFLLDNIIKNNKELKKIKNLKCGDTFSYTLDNGDVVQARFQKALMAKYDRQNVEKGEGQIILKDTDPSTYEDGTSFKVPEIVIELVGDGSIPAKTQLTISMPELIKNSDLVKDGKNFDIMDLQEKLPSVQEEGAVNKIKNLFGFAEGGAVMNEQMQMAFMMNEGGLRDDGMNRDPVSGNDVPSGSLAEEVRDDIPAQLSEGEYVVPADVVRYYGVKFFEDLRERAKIGLQEMEMNGRIGGEPVPAGGPTDGPLTSEEMAVLQELGMAEGGVVDVYKQQTELYTAPNPAIGNTVQMYQGGEVRGYDPGGDVTQSQQAEKDFYSSGAEAQQAGFVGFPLGTTVFGPSSSSTAVTNQKAFTPVELINTKLPYDIVMATTQELYDDYTNKGYVLNDGSFTPPVSNDGGGGGGGGGGDQDPPDPNAWAEGINAETSIEWVKSNLSGQKTGSALLDNITLSQNYARSAALANIAEAQGNKDLANQIRGEMKTVYDNSQFIRMMPGEFIDGSSIQGKLGDTIDLSVKTTTTPKKLPPQTFLEFGKSTTRKAKNVKASKNIRDKRRGSGMGRSTVTSTGTGADREYTSGATRVASETGADTSAAGVEAARESLEGRVRNIGGRNKGGLMTKGKKKKKK